MAQPAKHKNVKLIIGFIFKNEAALKNAEALISGKYGTIDSHSRIIAFSSTDYYNREFGNNLKRKFISLKRLINPEDIYRTKIVTNNMEHKLSIGGKRTINIDPGYLTKGKLVLLTTKDHVHRIYLRNGIYAESTLKFRHGAFMPWETTYPDYKTNFYIDVFNKIRDIYKKQLDE